MLIVLLTLRLALSVVLAVAGISKLFDRRGFEDSLSGFQVPDRLIDFFVWALPAAELAIAAGLLASRTVFWSAVAASCLFAVFTALVAVNVRQGNEIECRCFGNLQSGAVDRKTVVRNVVLTVLALLLVFFGQIHVQQSLVGWLDQLTSGERILFATEALSLAILGTLIHFALQLQKRLTGVSDKVNAMAKGKTDTKEPDVSARATRPGLFSPNRGLPIGAPAPNFSLRSLDDEELTLERLIDDERPTLLTFIDPDCPPCDALLPSLERWDHEYADKLRIALISSGNSEDHAYMLATADIRRVVDNGSVVHKAYAASWTPSAVLISPRGTVYSHLANGKEAVENLVRHAVDGSGPWLTPEPPFELIGFPGEVGLNIGEIAPVFSLQNIEGKRIRLSDFVGQKVLLLFWSAACSFCEDIAGRIREFESNKPEGAPQILIITSSSGRATKRFGFRSAVLFARNTGVPEQFGALARPSGVLIDERGRVASEVQETAETIMALLGPRRIS